MKEQKLEKGDLVLKKDLEAVRKEIVSRGVEEIRREKREEGKMMEMIGERVEEIERERRKKNVMIFNLQESELGEATERYREDEENIGVLLLEEMGVEDIQIEKIIRLGKKNERNRPLLVRLRDEKSRGEIMKGASRLRHSIRFPKVYITKDMTESERENDKKLRNELREKRGRGGASFVIRKGRVMERQIKPLQKETEVNNNTEMEGAVAGRMEVRSDKKGEMENRRREEKAERPKDNNAKENF